jgi:hypothetical protein
MTGCKQILYRQLPPASRALVFTSPTTWGSLRFTPGFMLTPAPQAPNSINSSLMLAQLAPQTKARFDSFFTAVDSGHDIFTNDRPMFEPMA